MSWEPSECFDSVFCQWKQVVDMTNNSNKLTAASFSQNTVSFYMVDLSQVAPIGVPPTEVEPISGRGLGGGLGVGLPSLSQRPLSTSNRRSFHPNDKIEASEEQQEENSQSDHTITNDNSIADIYNVEEYNKIFRPQKEIRRPSNINPTNSNNNTNPPASIPTSTSFQMPKKPPLNRNLSDLDQKNDQSFIIDIKVAPAPQPPQQQQQNPVQQSNPVQYQTPQKSEQINQSNNNSPNVNQSFDTKLGDKIDKININDFMPSQDNQTRHEIADIATTIESGHESFMRAMMSRFKNLQIVRNMWINGNIKSALEISSTMNDLSLMADILNQINSSVNVWNLDISAILLPSIRDLIGSKYEEYAQTGSDSCKLIIKNFGKLIKANILTSVGAVGVDISREERQRKCNSCYNNFKEIISIIERKMNTNISNKLATSFREINLLMKTIET